MILKVRIQQYTYITSSRTRGRESYNHNQHLTFTNDFDPIAYIFVSLHTFFFHIYEHIKYVINISAKLAVCKIISCSKIRRSLYLYNEMIKKLYKNH